MKHSRNYNICLHTGIGKRYGNMTVETDGNRISGILELLQHKEPFCGTIDENGIMTISGSIMTIIKAHPFTAVGTVTDGIVRMTLKSGNDEYELTGKAS